MIKEYKFGLIIINGKQYAHDVEVRWTPLEITKPEKKEVESKSLTGGHGQVLSWWRRESHVIDLEDIQRALEQKPDLIIFGTGASGLARVTERVREEMGRRDIELIVDKTDEAVKAFNIAKEQSEKQGREKKVIGLFHLTC